MTFFFPFLQDTNICHFADGKTPFICDETLGNFPEKLEGKIEPASNRHDSMNKHNLRKSKRNEH